MNDRNLPDSLKNWDDYKKKDRKLENATVSAETYEMAMDSTQGRCRECSTDVNVELHHKLSKSKANKRLFPLFIHSIFNLVPLCGGIANNCHSKKESKYNITYREAAIFEEYLRRLKDD